jgi:FlaA1/EpsC-like NDP-sugar epimerase
MLLIAGLIAYLGCLMVRYRDRLLTGVVSRWLWHRRRTSNVGERVLIVGAGDDSQLAIWLLEKSKYASIYSIIGIVDDNIFKQGNYIGGYPVLGTIEELPEIVKEKNIGLILYAISNFHAEDKTRILKLCQGTSARCVSISDLMDLIHSHFAPPSKEVIA